MPARFLGALVKELRMHQVERLAGKDVMAAGGLSQLTLAIRA